MREQTRRGLVVFLGAALVCYLPLLELLKQWLGALVWPLGWGAREFYWHPQPGAIVPLAVLALVLGATASIRECLAVLVLLGVLAIVPMLGSPLVLAVAAGGMLVGRFGWRALRRQRPAPPPIPDAPRTGPDTPGTEPGAANGLLLLGGAMLAMGSSMVLFASGIPPALGMALLAIQPVVAGVLLVLAGRYLSLLAAAAVAVPLAAGFSMFTLQGWLLGHGLQLWVSGENASNPWPDPLGFSLSLGVLYLAAVLLMGAGKLVLPRSARHAKPAAQARSTSVLGE